MFKSVTILAFHIFDKKNIYSLLQLNFITYSLLVENVVIGITPFENI